ncbi:MAG: RNA polymerase sigma factor [Candidatus Yanofskybacteria bacterium]|nr:RNA polymerase sigma factor [Candidatus Yanofskybacteria bacterium]
MKPEHSTTEQEFLVHYDLLADPLFRHCYFRTSDREVSKDILQDAFIKTWQYIRKGQQVDNMKAFLYKVTNNLIVDWSRKKREISLDSLMDQGFDVPVSEQARLEAVVESKHMLEVLHRLDPKYRDAIVFRYIDDLTPKEIAAITGETENVISVRIHRGLNQVRELLPQEV